MTLETFLGTTRERRRSLTRLGKTLGLRAGFATRLSGQRTDGGSEWTCGVGRREVLIVTGVRTEFRVQCMELIEEYGGFVGLTLRELVI